MRGDPDQGQIELLSGGLGCTVQDTGRLGHRHQGMACAGFLDAPLAAAANALAGNGFDAAALEWRGPGWSLRVNRGPVRIAWAGARGVSVQRGDGPRQRAPDGQSISLAPGDRLHLPGLEGGCAYLALQGGVLTPPVLGSRATHTRSHLGGLGGRMLQPGDSLPCGLAGPGPERRSAEPWPPSDAVDPAAPIRFIWGPQQDHFSAEALARFTTSAWQATTEQDRMGLRLAGPLLAHRDAASADIISDGVAPGAIQVPANGQPIVLLADGQTVGGYPKIGAVIRADLPRLAQARPGTRLHFAAVEPATARQALREQQARLLAWARALARCPAAGWLDEAALRSANLISGMLRAES